MPEISTTKKPAQKRERFFGALFSGGRVLIVSFAKTIYALWLEVTGMLFAVFAVAGASGWIKHYRKTGFAEKKPLWSIGIFTVVCVYFTIVSFSRAKTTRK